MSPTVARTTKNHSALWQHRFGYTLTASVVVACLYLLLYMVGFVPESFRYAPTEISKAPATAAATTSLDDLDKANPMPTTEQPSRVVIPQIGVDTVVKNPVTTDTATLNNYLAEGAVRWPDSGLPGAGNVFLFGHSTSYETVFNQAYKTFNRVQELEEDDPIIIETASGIFTYRVISVEMKPDSAAYIPFDASTNMLTISTCNTLGQKEDRHIVRARLADYQPH